VLDIAFLPLQVLLVSVLIERLLAERERQALIRKLNMVIGAFFSEMGMELLRNITSFCVEAEELSRKLDIETKWKPEDFDAAIKYVQDLRYHLEPDPERLEDLLDFLLEKRTFVRALLQNPNLLAHDAFTNLLWAVTHLTEELEARDELAALPDSDIAHLKGDISRAYGLLIREWLAYMRHLQSDYPYIYSLSVRTAPFKKNPSPVIENS